jgi:hypothetical protein
MNNDDDLLLLPGDCFRIHHPDDLRIAQVLQTTQNGNIAVSLWSHDPDAAQVESWNYYHPVILKESGEEATMERPNSLASLVFVFPINKITTYSTRFVYGTSNIFCISSPSSIFIRPSPQSLSYIINDAVNRISSELQRVLSNRRQNQSTYSASNIPITAITWRYLVEYLNIPEVSKDRPLQSVVSRAKDLSLTQVKKKITCHILRVEDQASIIQFIDIFGICSVVGIRKHLTSMVHRLDPNDAVVSACVAVQLLDVINIVDIESNAELGPRLRNSTFSFNGNGYKGVDLIFMPDVSSLRVSVRYCSFIVQDALAKLHALGISTNIQPEQRQRLTDEEIELLL